MCLWRYRTLLFPMKFRILRCQSVIITLLKHKHDFFLISSFKVKAMKEKWSKIIKKPPQIYLFRITRGRWQCYLHTDDLQRSMILSLLTSKCASNSELCSIFFLKCKNKTKQTNSPQINIEKKYTFVLFLGFFFFVSGSSVLDVMTIRREHKTFITGIL